MDFRTIYDTLLPAGFFAGLFRTPERIAEELSYFDNPKSVFEVGTAEAYNLRRLVRNGIIEKAAGYDISEIRLHRGQRKIHAEGLDSKITLHLGNGKDLPFDTNSYDVGLLLQVLEHVPSREGVIALLEESMRVSIQGLLISLPLIDPPNPFFDRAVILDPDHLRCLKNYGNSWLFHHEKVEAFFKELGLAYQRSERNPMFYRIT